MFNSTALYGNATEGYKPINWRKSKRITKRICKRLNSRKQIIKILNDEIKKCWHDTKAKPELSRIRNWLI